MRVLMTTTIPLSADGITMQLYKSGEEYDMPDSLSNIVVRNGWGKAVEVKEPKEQGDDKKDGKKDGDEKKAAKGPRENK